MELTAPVEGAGTQVATGHSQSMRHARLAALRIPGGSLKELIVALIYVCAVVPTNVIDAVLPTTKSAKRIMAACRRGATGLVPRMLNHQRKA